MARKILVEMDEREFARFQMTNRLLDTLGRKTGTTDEQVMKVVEDTIEGLLKKPLSKTA